MRQTGTGSVCGSVVLPRGIRTPAAPASQVDVAGRSRPGPAVVDGHLLAPVQFSLDAWPEAMDLLPLLLLLLLPRTPRLVAGWRGGGGEAA